MSGGRGDAAGRRAGWKRAFTNWPPRKIASAVLGVVSLDAGQISYTHALAVMTAHHVPVSVVWGEPALADLCIVGSTFNLIDAFRHGVNRRTFPYLSLAGIVVAAAVTLWMNVEATSPLNVPVWCVNGWPPVAFGQALESVLSLLRRKAADPAAERTQTLSPRDALAVFVNSGPRRDVAAAAGVSHATIQTMADALKQPLTSVNGSGPHA